MDVTSEVTVSRTFRGIVRRDMAEQAARLAAELAAYEQATRILAKQPDMHFLTGPHTAGDSAGYLADRALYGAARMIFAARPRTVDVQGFPPHLQVVVRLALEPPENLRTALHDALQRHDLLEMYSRILVRQKELIEQYDELAAVLLPLDPRQDGGLGERRALQSVVQEMAALDTFIALLPLYEGRWTAPEKAKEALAQAERLAPNNPLVLTALAELLLQLDRPASALEYVSRAVGENPAYARAHDVRGAVLLRQHLPALAVESFSRAIALAPRNALYYMHRASAYLVQEEEAGMCRDLQSACGLGSCDGLQWAASAGKCESVGP